MGEESSFDEFYLGTRDRILRQLTAMTLDRELAADASQEAYARAWQRWSRVSRMDDPIAWVRTVAWRLAVSQFRRRAVASRALGRLGPTASLDGLEMDTASGLDLVAALRTLSHEHRRVLVLHEMVGLTIHEIADETGGADGTVKSRLSRARERMISRLGSDYPSGAAGDGSATLVREERS